MNQDRMKDLALAALRRGGEIGLGGIGLRISMVWRIEMVLAFGLLPFPVRPGELPSPLSGAVTHPL